MIKEKDEEEEKMSGGGGLEKDKYESTRPFEASAYHIGQCSKEVL